MADFPTALTNVTPGLTEIQAKHINNLEAKVGIDGSAVVTSLDYLLKNPASANPGHKHTLANSATDVTATAAELNLLDLSGLTAGWVLRATGAAAAAWGAIQAGDLPTAIDATKIADGSVSNAEYQYLANVTSDIQGQLGDLLPTATYQDAASIDPGHKHSKLWASDGSPEAVTVDAAGYIGFRVAVPTSPFHFLTSSLDISSANINNLYSSATYTGTLGSKPFTQGSFL